MKGWQLGRLNHVAIAVPDLQKATALYRDVLGAEVSDVMVGAISTSVSGCWLIQVWMYTHAHTQPLPEHGVYTVFVNLGNTKIEVYRLQLYMYMHASYSATPSPCVHSCSTLSETTARSSRF